MIQFYPTKKGTGVTILGDYADLVNLYNTVNKIAGRLYNNQGDDKCKGQSQIISSFGYELRHAFQGSRLKEKMDFPEQDVHYLGFQYCWPDLLFSLSILRHNAGYVPLDELDQANLYLLEYWTKKALFQFDPVGAENIQHFICQRIDVFDKHIYLLIQAIGIEYLNQKPSIKRFRNIPNLLISFTQHTDKYKSFISAMERNAQECQCNILEIELIDPPTIIW